MRISKSSNLSVSDMAVPRFQAENMASNLSLVRALAGFAVNRDMTLAQVSLAWLLARAPHVVPIPGTKRSGYLTQNMASTAYTFSNTDMQELDRLLAAHPTQGLRYSAAAMQAYKLTS